MPTPQETENIEDGGADQKLTISKKMDGAPSTADIPLLLKALSDQKWGVRKQAAETLGGMGTAVLEPLEGLLADGSEDQKFWVVKALVKLGGDAVPVLIRSLANREHAVRICAATALGSIGRPDAIPHLVEALGDPVWRVRRNAYEALVSFGAQALDQLQDGIN